MLLKGVNEMSDDDSKVIKFPTNAKPMSQEDVMNMVGIQMNMAGIHPPFTIFPGREDLSGVAARAAILRFADIIEHEDLSAATDLRKIVIDIENQLGNITK